jgi:hypothetical protein
MRKLLLLAVAVSLIYGFVYEKSISIPLNISLSSQSSDSTLQNAYKNRQSDLQVQGEGVVIKLLRDDLRGSRHQKFILKLSTGQTLLVSHNIDLAPRINRLKTGDTVEFHGEYEWNSKGGVIHWTHHDPDGRHIGGWLKHKDKTYK